MLSNSSSPPSSDSHLEADAVDGDVVEHEGLEARGRVRHQHCLGVLKIEKLKVYLFMYKIMSFF